MESHEKGDLVFACDVNLGFPTGDPEWAAFFRDHRWRTENYDDMGRLTAALKAHVPSAARAFAVAAS